MDKDSEYIENREQAPAEALAEAQEMLKRAEDWVLLTTTLNKDADSDRCELLGSAKFFAGPERLVEMMVATGMNEPTFGRAVLKAALVISRYIRLQEQEQPNK